MNLFKSFTSQIIHQSFPRQAKASFDETGFIANLLKRYRKDSIMIDVGAHHGSACAPFQEMGWKIFAFEPNPSNRSKLVSRFGSSENVLIDSRAVSDQESENVDFYVSDVSTGISGMLAFHESHEQKGTVDVTTIKSIVEENNIRKINFLKIDVEGYDFSVLRGVPWDEIQPDVIECEFEDAKTKLLGHSWRDICKYLMGKGYTVYVSEWHPIVQYGVSHDWHALKKYPCDLTDEEAWGNLLAFKSDPKKSDINEALSEALQFRNKEYNQAQNNQADNSIVAPSIFNEKIAKYILHLYAKLSMRYGKYFSIFSLLKLLVPTGLGYFKRNKFISLILIISMLGFLVISFMDPQTYSPKYYFIPFFVFMIGYGLIFRKYIFYSQKHQFADAEILKRIGQLEDKALNISGEVTSELNGFESKALTIVSSLGGEISKLERKVLKLVMDSESRFPYSNKAAYQPFNRYFNVNDSYIIRNKWCELLSIDVDGKALSYIADRIRLMEAFSKGRLAATIEDIVLRIIVCKSIANKDVVIVEIGSLFGICLSSIYDNINTSNYMSQVIAIDPLDGYYGENRTDPFTGEFVDENTFHYNMNLIGPEKNYTLLKHLSTDQEAIDHVAKTKCDVLIIDGDHSYQGVKNDFDLYMPFVNKGGYIIFDDYNAEDWPDVKEFVDKEVIPSHAVNFVGAEWRTAVFMVV